MGGSPQEDVARAARANEPATVAGVATASVRQLRRALLVPRRIASPRRLRRDRGDAEALENLANHVGRGDGGEHTHRFVASTTGEDIGCVRTAQKSRPVEPRRCRDQKTAEQSVPVGDRKHVRGQIWLIATRNVVGHLEASRARRTRSDQRARARCISVHRLRPRRRGPNLFTGISSRRWAQGRGCARFCDGRRRLDVI
jgi:hypothetical protein